MVWQLNFCIPGGICMYPVHANLTFRALDNVPIIVPIRQTGIVYHDGSSSAIVYPSEVRILFTKLALHAKSIHSGSLSQASRKEINTCGRVGEKGIPPQLVSNSCLQNTAQKIIIIKEAYAGWVGGGKTTKTLRSVNKSW